MVCMHSLACTLFCTVSWARHGAMLAVRQEAPLAEGASVAHRALATAAPNAHVASANARAANACYSVAPRWLA